MKNSDFINESVYKTNLKYVKLQNETEELFFRCLDEKQPLEYFEEELKKIWGGLDREFFEKEIEKYTDIIHEQNMEGKEIEEETSNNTLLSLTPVAVVIGVEKLFQKQKEKEYKRSLNSYAYKNDKDEYLKRKVSRYSNQIVPYYSKTTGKKIRDVQLSTYVSMIHNTNLTRTAWNTTLNDADALGESYFYIPYHSFSCEYCNQYQGKPLSKKDVMDFIGKEVEEQEGDILHPNCKCTLNIMVKGEKIPKIKYSKEEIIEQYEIRQKVNSLTLQKERILTDIRVQKRLGNQDEVDKLNQQRGKINSSINELTKELPTKQLQKQVVAIKR